MKLELVATATFGLEAVVRREIEKLGYKIISGEDGRITYSADEEGIAKSNLWLRSADRVLLKMGEFEAKTFEDLFQGMLAIEWEKLIPEDGNFVVNGTSVKSTLSSVPACQSVAEKAIVKRMQQKYGEKRFSKTGAKYDIKIRILKDFTTVTVDTSGAGLHKRGYRTSNVEAPIKETLAAALVQLTFWREGRLLCDPFCGSGTIPIEAAMIGHNIAPGLGRKFVSEEWALIKPEIWKNTRNNAYKEMNTDAEVIIRGSDISSQAIASAKENAENAGVLDSIVFERKPFKEIVADSTHGIVLCNPPYGERIGEMREIESIYRDVYRFFSDNPTWSLFLITADKDFEQKSMKRPADRRRKLYNGRIETTYFQYYGEK